MWLDLNIKAHNGVAGVNRWRQWLTLMTHLRRGTWARVLLFLDPSSGVCQWLLNEGPLCAECCFIRALFGQLKVWKWKRGKLLFSAPPFRHVRYLDVSKSSGPEKVCRHLNRHEPMIISFFSPFLTFALFSRLSFSFPFNIYIFSPCKPSCWTETLVLLSASYVFFILYWGRSSLISPLSLLTLLVSV